MTHAGVVEVATPDGPVGFLADLRRRQGALERTSTAERVAALLREQITAGALRPGERLAEDGIAAALQVSRNTLREAFRLLSHERLVVHELNRGVFVRTLRLHDVTEVYAMRRLLECGVLREVAGRALDLSAVAAAVADGEHAAGEQRWTDAGTANMRLHQALVALGGSERAVAAMRGLLAELRLVFHVMTPQALHEPYLQRNRDLLELLSAGEAVRAADVLHDYLLVAERQLVQAYRAAH